MHLLWIAVLIQTLFFIVNDAHFYVLTFIGLSLILQAFSKNPLVFLLVPMIIVHLLFVYWPVQEGFKIGKKIKKTSKKAGKTAKNTTNEAKKTTTNTVNSATNNKLDDEPPDHGSTEAVNEEISNPEGGVTVPPPPEPLDIASNTPA